MKKRVFSFIYCILSLLTISLSQTACRRIPPISNDDPEVITPSDSLAEVIGVYILNEGNMGGNKASLDYYSYTTGEFFSNIFLSRNPQMTKDLGDVGNDIQIYGSKMYAVINCSNLIEVMHAENALHIGEIEIPNCRYIVFDKGYAYVTSYAGPVEMNPNARRGYVAKIDTATLSIVDTLLVGYQPEQMAIVNGRLFVANSGGYMAPNYDNRVSVINLATFKVEKEITVAPNLHRIATNSQGKLFVSSRGDYIDVHKPKLFVVDPTTNKVTDSMNISVGNMCMLNDTLYVLTANFYSTNKTRLLRINTNTLQTQLQSKAESIVLAQSMTPYGLAVNPGNGDIFVSDAKTYVVPGMVYCFSREGKLKFSIIAGEIPAHFAFLKK
ncbi:MAG: YncE family protein [Paludibacteraceae bacterium]|nr:YncE family protein [Paludibacteraceae bacterium]